VLSRFFSLLLPLPTAAFSTIMAKRNATAEELEAQAKSNGYKEGPTERKTALETTGRTTIRLRGIKMWYWIAM
jgi:hypothetical protein